jgi:hypothetical protein
MRARRPAITLLVVMILVAGALSAAERDRKGPDDTTTTTVAQAPALSAGREVVAKLPSGKPVQAGVGDRVVLRVSSATPDIAQMLELGLQTAVGPELPGELRFVAQAPGTFPVVLQVAGTKAGIVEVSEAK